MIDLSPARLKNVLLYLSSDVSNTEGVAGHTGLSMLDAEQLEIKLVTERFLARQPGFYANPRYFLHDSGLVWLALADGRKRDTQDLLTAIKSSETGNFYAGGRLDIYHAAMALVQQGYLETLDGGATFGLAQAAVE